MVKFHVIPMKTGIQRRFQFVISSEARPALIKHPVLMPAGKRHVSSNLNPIKKISHPSAFRLCSMQRSAQGSK